MRNPQNPKKNIITDLFISFLLLVSFQLNVKTKAIAPNNQLIIMKYPITSLTQLLSVLFFLTTRGFNSDSHCLLSYNVESAEDACELGAFELGACELGAFELGAVELGAFELGACELGAFELGAVELGVFELGAGALGAGELDAGALGVGELILDLPSFLH
jgi:hypothetical protein